MFFWVGFSSGNWQGCHVKVQAQVRVEVLAKCELQIAFTQQYIT